MQTKKQTERKTKMDKYLIVIHQNGKIQNVVGMYDTEKDARNMLLILLQDDMYIYPDEFKKYVYPVYYGKPTTWQEIEADNDLDEYHLDFKPVGDLKRYEVADRVVEIIKENELKIERE